VLSSQYDAFGVAVNEAMCCGCPVMVSDQVGAARDLVAPVRADFVFRTGDVAALASAPQIAFADRQKLHETALRGWHQVETHSPQRTVTGTAEAVRKAVQHVAARGKKR
jgi:glycosyltransferase involved in cell wall biosynthesis